MHDPERFMGYDMTPVKPLAARLEAFYESIQPPGADPMLDFDERDLVRHAERAGFADVSLELRVTVKNGKRHGPLGPCPADVGKPARAAAGRGGTGAASADTTGEFRLASSSAC